MKPRPSKDIVRQESKHVTDASLAATMDAIIPLLGDFTASLKRGRRLDDAYLNALTDRIVGGLRSRPNVLFVDSVRKPTRSIALKGRTEVFCAVMEPSNEGSTYSVSRLHVSLDRTALAWSYDDSGLMLVPHLAERMIERGESRPDALRRAGRALTRPAPPRLLRQGWPIIAVNLAVRVGSLAIFMPHAAAAAP